jgi:DNA-binding response OmpR family regulator
MAGHRLLVVEDQTWSRHPLSGIFGRLGWEVSVAGTVADGLRLLNTQPEPCCLVLDLNLPDGRGEDILQKVRDMGLRTRVVVATGIIDPERKKLVSELAPDALLTKPIVLPDVWTGECRVCEGGIHPVGPA